MAELPTGTVTFLFTDIEGSTRRWEEQPEPMKASLAQHDLILQEAVADHDGVVISEMGDGIAAVFGSAPGAVAAALEAQTRLAEAEWEATGPLTVRMGLHADEGRFRADNTYENRPLNRCARLMAVGHGGQVLISDTVEALTRNSLPPEGSLIALGPHRLRDLTEPMGVFQLAHPALRRDFPALRSLDSVPGNLPRQRTSFVGREDEVRSLSALVDEQSVVTITGVGGVGKTRLALQVASDAGPTFRSGAWLCELGPLTAPEAVWEGVAAALDIQPTAGGTVEQSLLDVLATKRLLLVLDNCEHLLDAAADLVQQVTESCPEVTILATSREGLAVAGEHIVAIPSLGLPPADGDRNALDRSDAVQLFVERARESTPEFVLAGEDAGAIAHLCRRLDGIPLAIELAAARMRSLSPQELVARLDQRFKLLTRGSRAGLERHQTLRSTIDWSYDLLSDGERAVLNQVSVFTGGFTLEAAEAVVRTPGVDAADVADALGQLVDKSLLVADRQESSTRYRLLETIRQYAQEHLEGTTGGPEVRRRHAEYYIQFAEDAGPHLRSRDQQAWLPVVERETENLRLALDHALDEGAVDLALRLVPPLAINGTRLGFSALAWAEAICRLEATEPDPRWAAVLGWATWGRVLRAEFDEAATLLERTRAAAQATGTRSPLSSQAEGTYALLGGDEASALRAAEEWVGLARSAGDEYELAEALVLLASALLLSDIERAVETCEEATRLARDGGFRNVLSIGLSTLGSMLQATDPERALVVLDEATQVGLEIGDQSAVNNAIISRAWIAALAGDWPAALSAARDALDRLIETGELVQQEGIRVLVVISLVERGWYERAAVLSVAGHGRAGADHPAWVQDLWVDVDRSLDTALSATRLAELRSRGAALDVEARLTLLDRELDSLQADLDSA